MRKIALAAALALSPTLALAAGHSGAGSMACLSMASSVEKDFDSQAAQLTTPQQEKIRDLLQVAKVKCETDANVGDMALGEVREEMKKAGLR